MSDQSPAGGGTTTTKAAKDGHDPLVSLAFAIGWQMADLYRQATPKDRKTKLVGEGLPDIGSFTPGMWTELGIDQLEAGLHRLTPRLEDAQAAAPSLTDVRAAFAKPNVVVFRQQLKQFHIDLITVLTAADFKLGKAYALGNALSDTVRFDDYAELNREWSDSELAKIVGWLADLESAFPIHSARAVMLCIEHWELWLAPRCECVDAERALWKQLPQPGWTEIGRDVRRGLFGQGRDWRALLSGEKHGTDMLSTEDYVDAAGRALSHTRAVAFELLWKFREIVALAVALLVLGVVLAVSSQETAKILAGAGAVASAFGLSWKTLGTGFRALGEQVKDPLWGAEVDVAIAGAITVLPPPLPDKRKRKQRRAVAANLSRKYSPTGPGDAVLTEKPRA
jgi:hypothetical protein